MEPKSSENISSDDPVDQDVNQTTDACNESEELLSSKAQDSAKPLLNQIINHTKDNNYVNQTKIEKSENYRKSLDNIDLEFPDVSQPSPRTKSIQSRTVLWYLVFIGFAINYMIRINMNITIVDMVKSRQQQQNLTNTTILTECFNRTFDTITKQLNSNSSATIELMEPKQLFSVERVILNSFNIPYEKSGFTWDETQQGLVLGAFFYLHWLTQIPGGILARKYGTKIVFGLSNFIGCLICFIIPLASFWDIKLLIFIRLIQGLICGLAWPSMHHLTAQWIPPNERSKFVSAYLGSSVGIAVFYPLFGYVISWSSWEWVYHLCGIFGILWYSGWVYFVYDTPAQHPRIDPIERDYIENSLGVKVATSTADQQKKRKTPWKKILLSQPVWLNVIAQWGGIWGLFTLMTQAPTYLKVIHGWGTEMTGLISGFPHLLRMIFSYIFSLYSDYLLRTEKMSVTNVRKLSCFVCCSVHGFFVVFLAYSGCNTTLAIFWLSIATMCHGAVASGPLASIIDLSPKYSSLILGLAGMIGVIPGFISPYIVGKLTLNNQTIEQWKYVFLLAAFMLIASGILYILFSDSTLQSWDHSIDDDVNDLDKKKQKKSTIYKSGVPLIQTDDMKNTKEKT